MYDLLQGKVSISELREVRVEDLLHRETVSLEENLVGFLGGKVVMVTGAGGSIGSELARQVARFSPSRLLLVEGPLAAPRPSPSHAGPLRWPPVGSLTRSG